MFLGLASKVKSLALASKAASPRKCPVLGSRTALFFALLEVGQGHGHFFFYVLEQARDLVVIHKDLFCFFILENVRNFSEILQNFWVKTFFVEITCKILSLVIGLGLESSCPWPRKGLSSGNRCLAMASNFFVSLASSVVSSTPPLIFSHVLQFLVTRNKTMFLEEQPI